MLFVSQALEWVRALLFGAQGPIGKAIPDRPAQVPLLPAPSSPETRAATLVFACLCRAGRVPAPPDVQRDQYDAHPLVRAYVIPPGNLQHALYVGEFAEAGQ